MFIPVSGGAGGGELQRSLIIARAARVRWPALAIRFLVHSQAPFPREEFECIALPASPTRCEDIVAGAITDFAPTAILFDSTLRMSALRAARATGSKTIYLSARPNSRWRGLDPRKRALLDEHLILLSGRTGPVPLRERLGRALLGRTHFEYLSALFEAPDHAAAQALLDSLGLVAGQFVLVCPGGAGYVVDGRSPMNLFADAWRQVPELGGVRALAIGPGDATLPEGWIALPNLPNRVLMGVVAVARLNMINGGSLLVQALALGAACLAIPMQDEQAQRISGFHARHAVLTARATVEEVAIALRTALAAGVNTSALRARARGLGLSNDLALAIERIAAHL